MWCIYILVVVDCIVVIFFSYILSVLVFNFWNFWILKIMSLFEKNLVFVMYCGEMGSCWGFNCIIG